jgi:hypothetical protein
MNIWGRQEESHRKEGYIVLLAFILSKIKGKEGWILQSSFRQGWKEATRIIQLGTSYAPARKIRA